MTTFERRYTLLRLLRDRPGIRIGDIAQELAVSEGTVRNDFRALEDEGQLRRVWGGAVVQVEPPLTLPGYAARSAINPENKAEIARAAAAMVQDGDAILMDASTTVFGMAEYLRERRNLTAVTNGIDVGRAMAANPANIVVLLGGILRTDGTAVTRPLTETTFKDLHIRTAFMSASAFSLERGLTEADFHEAQFKKAMVEAADHLIVLIDSSKFGKTDLSQYAPVSKITHLISDSNLAPVWREKMDELGIVYTIGHQKGPA